MTKPLSTPGPSPLPPPRGSARRHRRWRLGKGLVVLACWGLLLPPTFGSGSLANGGQALALGPESPLPAPQRSAESPRALVPPVTESPSLLGAGAWAQPNAHRDPYSIKRWDMVKTQILQRGVRQEPVLEAMRTVPRHEFVASDARETAYDDEPVAIGWGQSIYQPYIVARMTELLELGPEDRVLEIGTGSGYHSAVLSLIADEVFTIEINDKLAKTARRNLSGYTNVNLREGDGYKGWKEHAPFDAILFSVAPPEVPQDLLQQLRIGGRMVVPVGNFLQDLQVITRTETEFLTRIVEPVRVNTMSGEIQNPER
ncbi:MAG: protein-L-isoaspartate(D-aspartate) O-methyltransferase [Acidobacteriota bacterium]